MRKIGTGTQPPLPLGRAIGIGKLESIGLVGVWDRAAVTSEAAGSEPWPAPWFGDGGPPDSDSGPAEGGRGTYGGWHPESLAASGACDRPLLNIETAVADPRPCVWLGDGGPPNGDAVLVAQVQIYL